MRRADRGALLVSVLIFAACCRAVEWVPPHTAGGIYSGQFLKSVASLHSPVMGVENMAPLLYTITRFVKVHSPMPAPLQTRQ